MLPPDTFGSIAARLREFMDCANHGSFAVGDEKGFNRLALEIHAWQFENNAAVRRWSLARRSNPSVVKHWTQIPAIPAAAFKEWEVSCLPADQRSRVFWSSGTTLGLSSRHYHSEASLALYEASLWPWFQRHLLPGVSAHRLSLLALAPPANQAEHSSLVHMFDTVNQQMHSFQTCFAGSANTTGTWQLDTARALSFLEECVAAGQPVLMLTTAFMLVHLLDTLAERRSPIRLPEHSTIMETGGYKGRSREIARDELHRLTCTLLGVAPEYIVREYGMAELSSQAYDGVAGKTRRDAKGFQFPPWARARIVSPETGAEVAPGESGLIQIIDLANLGSSIAVQTEDLGTRSHSAGFELLGRAALAEARGCSLLTV